MAKMTDYRTKMTDSKIFNTFNMTKMTDFMGQNDRFYGRK